VPRLPRLGFPPGPPFRGAPWKKESPGGKPIPPRAVINASLRSARAWGPWARPAAPRAPGPPCGSRPLQCSPRWPLPSAPSRGLPHEVAALLFRGRPAPRLHRCVRDRSCSMRASASPAGRCLGEPRIFKEPPSATSLLKSRSQTVASSSSCYLSSVPCQTLMRARAWPRSRPRSCRRRKHRARMPQDPSVEAWPMSSIPAERNNRKSSADSFSLGEARGASSP